MKLYIKTQEYNADSILYGVGIVMNNDDKSIETYAGIMKGADDEVTNQVTKNALIKYKDVAQFVPIISVKYEDLTTTKQMFKTMKYDSFYETYSKQNRVAIEPNPSVFLSDNYPMVAVGSQMNKHKALLSYHTKEQNTK